MSYLTINKRDEQAAMELLSSIADYSTDLEVQIDLHDLLKAATGHDEILVRE